MAANRPTTRQVQFDTILGDVSVAYVQTMRGTPFSWAAELVPRIPVSSQTVKYPVFNKGDFMRVEMKPRGTWMEAAVGGFGLTYEEETCKRNAVKKQMPREVVKNFPKQIDADKKAVQWLTQQAYLKREANIADKFFTTGVWSGQTDQAGVDSSSPSTNEFERIDRANSTLRPFQRGCEAVQLSTGRWPNRIAMGVKVWQIMANHAEIIERRNNNATGGLFALAASIGDFFGIPAHGVKILGAVQNTAEAEQTPSMAHIMGTGLWLGYVSESQEPEDFSALYNFTWDEFDMLKTGASIRRIERPEYDGYELETETYDAQVVAAADAGCWFSSVINATA